MGIGKPRIGQEIVGQTKGRVTVIELLPYQKRRTTRILIQCDCGGIRQIEAREFRKDHNRFIFCTCNRSPTGDLQKDPLYGVWRDMKTRCFNKNDHSYCRYGGRGITVCKRWLNFLNYYEDNKALYKPGLTMDRINNDGNYCPENVQWIPRRDNSRKTRSIKIGRELALKIYGSALSSKDIAKKYGISVAHAFNLKKGKCWDVKNDYKIFDR